MLRNRARGSALLLSDRFLKRLLLMIVTEKTTAADGERYKT
jgi:hypothetical protein